MHHRKGAVVQRPEDHGRLVRGRSGQYPTVAEAHHDRRDRQQADISTLRLLCAHGKVFRVKRATGCRDRGLAGSADELMGAGGADPARCWALTLMVARFSVAASWKIC